MRKILLPILILLGMSFSPSALAQDFPAVGVEEGEMYPDFVLPTVAGELKRFSDYRGKKVLLFHFASW